MPLLLLIFLVAKLERGTCLIVYFGFKSDYCYIADYTKMKAINKIHQQVLVQQLQRENLICSFMWFFQPVLRAMYLIEQLSPEVRRDLASKYQLYKTETHFDLNCPLLEQLTIGTSH